MSDVNTATPSGATGGASSSTTITFDLAIPFEDMFYKDKKDSTSNILRELRDDNDRALGSDIVMTECPGNETCTHLPASGRLPHYYSGVISTEIRTSLGLITGPGVREAEEYVQVDYHHQGQIITTNSSKAYNQPLGSTATLYYDSGEAVLTRLASVAFFTERSTTVTVEVENAPMDGEPAGETVEGPVEHLPTEGVVEGKGTLRFGNTKQSVDYRFLFKTYCEADLWNFHAGESEASTHHPESIAAGVTK
jgi:hypothetical protein